MKSLIWFGAVLALLACGRAGSPRLQKNPVLPAAVQSFPAQNLHLTQNLILLWKPDVTAQQVAQVSQLGQQYVQDQMTLAGLQAQKPQLPTDVFQAQWAAAQTDLGQVVQKLAGVTAGFFALQSADFALSDPSHLTAALSGVASPGAAPFTLSTSNRVIHDLLYQEWGGQLDFTAEWPNHDRYAFHLARDHYELSAKGMVSFSGAVTVTRAAGGTLTGTAKFAGKAQR